MLPFQKKHVMMMAMAAAVAPLPLTSSQWASGPAAARLVGRPGTSRAATAAASVVVSAEVLALLRSGEIDAVRRLRDIAALDHHHDIDAAVETIVALDVYRTYADANGLAPGDRERLAHALDVAPSGAEDDEPERADVHGFHVYPARMHPTTASRLVRAFSREGGHVLDPFAGSGTTGAGALLEGMRFLGLEADPDMVRVARARLSYWARKRGVR